jgi:predicted Zn-dependent protease
VALFDVFKAQHGEYEPVEFLNTHPLTERRIQRVHSLADTKTAFSAGESAGIKLKPLPAEFTEWMAEQSAYKLPVH